MDIFESRDSVPRRAGLGFAKKDAGFVRLAWAKCGGHWDSFDECHHAGNFKLDNMGKVPIHRRKRSPTLYQKQIRFFTIMAITLIALLAGVIFWLLSRSSFPTH